MDESSNDQMDDKRCTEEAQGNLGHKKHCDSLMGREEEADHLAEAGGAV